MTTRGRAGNRHNLSALVGRLAPHVRYDLPASLVVFLVALPLSLGIAMACNAPLLAG